MISVLELVARIHRVVDILFEKGLDRDDKAISGVLSTLAEVSSHPGPRIHTMIHAALYQRRYGLPDEAGWSLVTRRPQTCLVRGWLLEFFLVEDRVLGCRDPNRLDSLAPGLPPALRLGQPATVEV